MLDNKSILITGKTGFFGKKFVETQAKAICPDARLKYICICKSIRNSILLDNSTGVFTVF